MGIFNGTIENLERGLSFASMKQKTIAQNIANVDTPNYKAKSVNFDTFLENARKASITAYRTEQKHLNFQASQSSPGVIDYSTLRYSSNGNGVDMDKEQANLATNQLYYNALVDRVSGKLNSLQTVIKGGG